MIACLIQISVSLRRTILTIVLFVVLCVPAAAQVLQSVEIEFQRINESSSGVDTTAGVIYYMTPDDLKLHVTVPLNQWMIFKEGGLDIYYPDDRLVYRVSTRTPTALPFFQAFVGVIKEDYGLTAMGYEMANYTSRGDTLETVWNPPAMAEKTFGSYRLNFVDDKIIYAELSDAEGNVTARSTYSDHLKFGAVWFPMMLRTVRYLESDSTTEKVIYSNPQFNKELPAEIRDFHIPDNVNIIETEW